jgi:enoyl-[acyl-carrier protein] reductase II
LVSPQADKCWQQWWLGAEAAQIGTRFVCSNEASSHLNFKKLVIESKEGDTMLSMKKVVPVRLLKNHFFNIIHEAEKQGASDEEIKQLLGRGRAKKGMFEGDMDEGELEIGQVSSLVKNILPASEIVKELWQEFADALANPLDNFIVLYAHNVFYMEIPK